MITTVAGPDTETVPIIQSSSKEKTELMPRWNVILFNDEEHTVDYVIEMLVKIFSHSIQKAQELTVKIHLTGQAIVDTTSKERAQLKQEQVHAYGADWRMGADSTGPVKCEIVPTE